MTAREFWKQVARNLFTDATDRAWQARVAELETELAKYVGHEPTLEEEALYAHEQQVRAKVAAEIQAAINRSRKEDGEFDGPTPGMARRRLGLLAALRIVQGDDQFGMPHAAESEASDA